MVSYVAGGAGTEHTQRANVRAFQHWGLMPRMLAGATKRDLSVDLFGISLPTPIFMAPIGVIGICSKTVTAISPRPGPPPRLACR